MEKLTPIVIYVDLARPVLWTVVAWMLWAASWGVAALWSRRTVGRPTGAGAWLHYIPVVLGVLLLFNPPAVRRLSAGAPWLDHRYWRVPEPLGWACCAATVASFAFAWWARVYLGALWSGSITRKEGHRVVDTGPYRLVRHPIYTGIIGASFLLAAELGKPAAFAGAALMTLGWWMKAREEERFLGRELGPAYDAYRRRTPMLFPFFGPRS